MTQYIDKDTLVAEIKKIYDSDYKFLPSDIVEGIQDFKDDVLRNIDTLEVKEVDLEKEFNNYTKNILACDVQCEPFTQLYNCAKHFFELGLKA